VKFGSAQKLLFHCTEKEESQNSEKQLDCDLNAVNNTNSPKQLMNNIICLMTNLKLHALLELQAKLAQ
jgi:hypothetical protein